MFKTDCRFFIGSRPCQFNKSQGQECFACPFYSQVAERILIIKLDAIGDVLRTTCIIPKIKEKYPHSYIVWITRDEALDLIKVNPEIDAVWTYGVETLSYLQVLTWDYVYSCSNDHCSAAMATMAKASKEKVGFLLSEDGVLLPTNVVAKLWLEMAVFDSKKRSNRLSYQELLYGICGFSGPIHRPQLVLPDSLKTWANSLTRSWVGKAVSFVGVNTGAGSRWPKKMPDVRQMIDLINQILARFPEIHVLLLGGPQEINKNRQILAEIQSSRVYDTGCGHSLLDFAALISSCQVLICGDTLALHIATALKIPTVALFGPTSVSEIHDYEGLIEKLADESMECLCCYSNCDKAANCMTSICIGTILDSLSRQMEPCRGLKLCTEGLVL